MRSRKIAACPGCCPDGGAIFRVDLDFIDDKVINVWKCLNCGTTKPVGQRKVSESACKASIEKIRKAIELSGSESFPTKIDEWKQECRDGIYLIMVRAHYGKNALAILSSRLLSVRISRCGGISLSYDSKAKSKKQLREIESRLRKGRLWTW